MKKSVIFLVVCLVLFFQTTFAQTDSTEKRNYLMLTYHLSSNVYDYSKFNINTHVAFTFDIGILYQYKIWKQVNIKTGLEYVQRKAIVDVNSVATKLYESFTQLPLLFVYNGGQINDNKNNRKYNIKKNTSAGAFSSVCIEQGYASANDTKYTLQSGVLNAYGKWGIIAECYLTFEPLKKESWGYLMGLRLSGDMGSYNIKNPVIQRFDKYRNISCFVGIIF